MKVKRSKDKISGKRPKPIEFSDYRDLVRVLVPNTWGGWNSIDFTYKEARRLASALLQYTKG